MAKDAEKKADALERVERRHAYFSAVGGSGGLVKLAGELESAVGGAWPALLKAEERLVGALPSRTRAPRLGKEDLVRPRRALVRFGEIYGGHCEMSHPEIATLEWEESVNPAGEAGIRCGGGCGYAGWDEKHKLYVRYGEGGLSGNEYCLAVLCLLPDEAPRLHGFVER